MGAYMVALYGSAARHENDALSDQDVVVLADQQVKVPFPQSEKLSVSKYSWEELQRMASYGSLFLWHLRREALPVEYNTAGYTAFRRILDGLGEYQFVERDVVAFRESVEDVSGAVELGDTSFEFELASLATVVRHASILGCYLIGSPQFGRYSSVEVFCRSRQLPSKIISDFPAAYSYRMAIARDLPMPRTPTTQEMLMWIRFASRVVEEVSLCSRQPLPFAG